VFFITISFLYKFTIIERSYVGYNEGHSTKVYRIAPEYAKTAEHDRRGASYFPSVLAELQYSIFHPQRLDYRMDGELGRVITRAIVSSKTPLPQLPIDLVQQYLRKAHLEPKI
jgi:hypothetical protein